uniref:Uncharacterized protein n=1 Tax=Myotis lucifugus TaxID=59463 RepID=G1QGE2_MYOLU
RPTPFSSPLPWSLGAQSARRAPLSEIQPRALGPQALLTPPPPPGLPPLNCTPCCS